MVILHCYVSCAEASDIGPYKQIYPRVDITQDQLACSVTENGSCPLYIALMVSFGGEFDSSGVIPGVQMALDQINADPTMLPGYTLHYTLRDTIVSYYYNLLCISQVVLIMITINSFLSLVITVAIVF